MARRVTAYDAVIVGAGPNGLAAAITIARAGRSVVVIEGNARIGGGMRSAELTMPGFVHDICSAIHPLGVGSPFMRTVPLERYGVEWIAPPIAAAHPLDSRPAAMLTRSVAETAAALGRDGPAYRRVIGSLARRWNDLAPALLGPLRFPRHPLALARFGVPALLAAQTLARAIFRDPPAQALLAGMSAHSLLPLSRSPSAAFGLVLLLAGHAVGWPFPRGGSQMLANAMAAYLRDLGGEIRTGEPVTTLAQLPSARVTLLDVTPRQALAIAGDALPPGYQRALQRFHYGPGAFKLDIALDGPIPWRDPLCGRAGTVHLGGTLVEIASSEYAIWHGETVDRPYVLLAQQSHHDPTRAPAGKEAVWAYCHVPNGSRVDMTERILNQIERFAPGFRDRILAIHTLAPADLEAYNPNYIGGDVNGGAQDLTQLFTRPTVSLNPYATAVPGLYFCSSSTPPGGGVHGMCGFHAARAAIHAHLR